MAISKCIIIKIILFSIGIVQALIAYDCKGNNLNITTLSLLKIGECDIPPVQPKIQNVDIQLLQLTDFTTTEVIQCKIEIDRDVLHCGMHSHISAVALGKMQYLHEISREECHKIHRTRAYLISSNNYITGLSLNGTSTRPIIFAGTIKTDGSCKGIQYSDPYGSWSDVIVQGTVKISVYNFYAIVKLNADTISMPSGKTCTLTTAACPDDEMGNSFWTPIPKDDYYYKRYTVLFEGRASLLQNNSTTVSRYNKEIYTLNQEDFTFALAKRGERKICGYTLIETEHPKLFIVDSRTDGTFAKKTSIDTTNMNIFTYVNSIFVYVEKHINQQLTTLYHDVLMQRCLLQQQVLENALVLAVVAPDEFAKTIMDHSGYMAVAAGEVIHIIKCIPVEVKIRHTTTCYQQLPVFRGNSSYFVTPRTHMLLSTGTEIDCNDIVPPMYLINDIWYKFSPQPNRAMEPIYLKPDSEPTWEYTSIDLATSGIYTEQDLEKLREHIMFPAEKPAVLSNVARGFTGHGTGTQGMSISHFLNEEVIETIARDTWEKTWGWFTGFGTLSAGFIGIWVFVKFAKFILDTILHGLALHTVYGWSLCLIGSFWDSLTNFLLHLGRNKEARDKDASQQTPTAPPPNNLEKGISINADQLLQQPQQKKTIYPQLKAVSPDQLKDQPGPVYYVHVYEN